MDLIELLKLAASTAIDAGVKILEIYETGDFAIDRKTDESPLTIADKVSNSIIVSSLKHTNIPFISEESKLVDFKQRRSWNTYWLVDPLDGTKEFIKRNGEFTVNIALCHLGKPILGIIYVPVTRELYYADATKKMAYKSILDEEHGLKKGLCAKEDRITKSESKKELVRIVGSRSHMNQDTLDYISSIKDEYDEVEIVSKGSSLKFCLVAEGKADVYPRFAPTMEWDTAAGHAICNAVGLKVISQQTNEELPYNKENLLNPYFLVSQ
ncbi:3'(2'),5'-bisphosphate nucleotidase CysQ [Winogradskyella sp.]|uniref:3'(2'),5'-bisphosphate nucleotidase CysQ n=1 Tax=Winogradskyella sp. TaxID=1883156 RepID=UPI0026273817|nr:3'(2'),5'-bisphosphate nucleotidase CysQ [Winogradskyella sp.]